MKKKGWAMQNVAMAILALVILIILIFVFKDQIGNVTGLYSSSTENAEIKAGRVCGELFTNTKCTPNACSALGEGWESADLKCLDAFKGQNCCRST